MANVISQYLDPNLLTPQAAAGTAQILSNQQAAFWAQLFTAANNGMGVETLDTTAANLTPGVGRTDLKVSGTMAFTLPNGTAEGQVKIVECISAASTPACTLTVTTPDATTGFVCAGAFFFDTVGQRITFKWMTTGGTAAWRAIDIKRAGGAADNVVIGTTVLTNMNMWLRYNCSVTSTVSSTGTKALPNGSAVGEQIWIACSTAASIPAGSIDGVYTSGLAAAYTHAGAIGVVASATAVGDSCLLTWTGSAWDCVYQNGITFS